MSKKTIINDKNLILTDALLCSFLEREAKSVGVALEEYVDRFLSVFYSDLSAPIPAKESVASLQKFALSNPDKSHSYHKSAF